MTDRPRDQGVVLVEYAAAFPVVAAIILLCFEWMTVSTTVERVDNAARTGARTAAQDQDVRSCPLAAERALPGWLNGSAVDGTPTPPDGSGTPGVTCRVRAKVPVLFPGVPLDFTVDRAVSMPMG